MFLVISYRNVLTEVFGRMWLAGVPWAYFYFSFHLEHTFRSIWSVLERSCFFGKFLPFL